MKKKQTASTIIEQIRQNSNVAYEANSISEQLEQFWEHSPEYIGKEFEDKLLVLASEFREIVRTEYAANERLLKEFRSYLTANK